jgi:hypothetical protein
VAIQWPSNFFPNLTGHGGAASQRDGLRRWHPIPGPWRPKPKLNHPTCLTVKREGNGTPITSNRGEEPSCRRRRADSGEARSDGEELRRGSLSYGAGESANTTETTSQARRPWLRGACTRTRAGRRWRPTRACGGGGSGGFSQWTASAREGEWLAAERRFSGATIYPPGAVEQVVREDSAVAASSTPFSRSRWARSVAPGPPSVKRTRGKCETPRLSRRALMSVARARGSGWPQVQPVRVVRAVELFWAARGISFGGPNS